MAIIVSIHLLEGSLELLEVMPVGLEADQDAKDHLLKLVSFGKVLDVEQHFLLGLSGHLLVVKFLVLKNPGMLQQFFCGPSALLVFVEGPHDEIFDVFAAFRKIRFVKVNLHVQNLLFDILFGFAGEWVFS